MITYPILKKHSNVGVTAPSSGVPHELHDSLKKAIAKMVEEGYRIECGETVWKQHKAKSAPAHERAAELNKMLQDDSISLIIPPWGGELLIEVLDLIDYQQIKPKWVLGYSDISALLLALTLKTGMATAHGTNLIDLRGEATDPTTKQWENVLSTERGSSVTQFSSQKYQKEWNHEKPSPHVFHLTEPTVWKTIGGGKVEMEGRVLGGCIDVTRNLIGTPYGDVASFREKHIINEPIMWYFENCEINTADLRRTLVQMKLAGWLDHTAGLLFGRSAANTTVDGYTAEDVYHEISDELQIPVVYDIDCGHQPPQITFINGAYGKVEVQEGQGKVTQTFR
ncbi:S66 peptidase family protein [Rossellomorea sp. KS-H15a]|uniref:S66 family peptidase n=1 Tax=Rossellomorea sp. KS-H15a TaxID=2963940 RepID=UPI0020C74501|nr:S66 peptidase family protein [Rossellomorea sp. KS-H15a]UTE75747.1 LD-carboxypeptidase [Rossellomorea sp. KS-H15a]